MYSSATPPQQLIFTVVLLVIATVATTVTTTDHIVGANRGWNPGINYTLWVNNQTFYVGDLIYSHIDSCIGQTSTLANGSDTNFTDAMHLYKNRLQSYALKNNLTLPAYSCEHEELAKVFRFRCTITFQGKTLTCSDFYPTVKKAKHAAAKLAWEYWSLDEVQQDDTALYKNLLQEFLQKRGCHVPIYEVVVSGPHHLPTFVSKLNFGGHVYEGQAASNKKQAESNVAKVAYLALQDRT